MGQIYDEAGNPANENTKGPKTKRRYDLALEWHLYGQLREDYNTVFTRNHNRALWYEQELGKNEIFDNPNKAKKYQENLTSLTWEIKVMAATYDFLNHFYEYSIEAHAALSEAYFEQKLRADLEKERADLNFKGYLEALDKEAQAYQFITNFNFSAHGKQN